MSSRRGAGEENILAMLERDSARRSGVRMSGIRLASYGAAAALAGILAGGIAWLAYDNHKGAQELQARHDGATVVVPPVMPEAVLPPQAPPAAAPASVIDAPRTAVIVDESARRRDPMVASAIAGGVPPLVMLPPQELTGSKPAPATARVPEERPAAKPAKPESAPPATRTGVEKKADKTPKAASRPAKPALARAAGAPKARPEAPGRARKAAADADTAVDSDVALISAIIQHSERHRGERDGAACRGAKCPPKVARP